MGEVIFLEQGLFGPKISRKMPGYGVVNKILHPLFRFVGRVALRVGKSLRTVARAIWMVLLLIAMLPGLVLYAVFFIFLLAVGFGILVEVGKAVGIFTG